MAHILLCLKTDKSLSPSIVHGLASNFLEKGMIASIYIFVRPIWQIRQIWEVITSKQTLFWCLLWKISWFQAHFWLHSHMWVLVGKVLVGAFVVYTDHENICIFDKCMIRTNRIQVQMLWKSHRHQLPSYALSNIKNWYLNMFSNTSNLQNWNVHPDVLSKKFLCICSERLVFWELCNI